MSRLTKWIRANCPGPVASWNVRLQRRFWPTLFWRRVMAAHRAAGSPRDVVAGPFRGMRYVPFAADKIFLPRLFGAYECEIHAAVEDLILVEPDAILVAGAGEGYYAVGLARRLPQARVFAYDTHRWARHLLGRMIAKNGVAARVQGGGFCSPREIQRHLAPAHRPALVCDVEGYEMALLNPLAAPVLVRTTMIVELHDRPGLPIEETLRERFSATHHVQEYETRPRTPADFPASLSLSEDDALWSIDEQQFRGRHQKWLYLKPFTLTRVQAA